MTPTYVSCSARDGNGRKWTAPSTAPRPYEAPLFRPLYVGGSELHGFAIVEGYSAPLPSPPRFPRKLPVHQSKAPYRPSIAEYPVLSWKRVRERSDTLLRLLGIRRQSPYFRVPSHRSHGPGDWHLPPGTILEVPRRTEFVVRSSPRVPVNPTFEPEPKRERAKEYQLEGIAQLSVSAPRRLNHRTGGLSAALLRFG
jgi:hypothetical protein